MWRRLSVCDIVSTAKEVVGFSLNLVTVVLYKKKTCLAGVNFVKIALVTAVFYCSV
jgi:hypothetical protein